MGGLNLWLLQATLVAAAIVMMLSLYLGFKYPSGWKAWPHDIQTTSRYAVSGILFLMILGLIYWITRYWDYPAGGKAMTYIAFFALGILFVLGIIFPNGRSI